jgi:hypothetical protein
MFPLRISYDNKEIKSELNDDDIYKIKNVDQKKYKEFSHMHGYIEWDISITIYLILEIKAN